MYVVAQFGTSIMSTINHQQYQPLMNDLQVRHLQKKHNINKHQTFLHFIQSQTFKSTGSRPALHFNLIGINN